MNANASIHPFQTLDFMVMAAYLLMLVSVGFLMKRLCRNTGDYFIGGNRVSWWLAGASCFMMSFSAWTFTGAAGFAYNHGVRIIVMFLFNVIAWAVMGLSLAAKCRQTRKMTYLQIVLERFGRITEQFFTYIRVPMFLFGGAIWLMGLATFVSVAFGLPMQATILISGVIIILYSTLSGSWGVMTTDFLQSLILVALTVTLAVLTLVDVGGPAGMVRQMSPERLQLFSQEHSRMWMFAYFIQIFVVFSSITGAPRFLAVRDGKDAGKAAFMAGIMMLLGPVIWFIPPLAATFLFPQIGEVLPGLPHPQDGAYVLMGLHLLPPGLAGLLLMVIFAATLSCMDSAINQNTAIVCMNFYKPILRPKAGEREMFVVAHLVNVLLGTLAIFMALLFSKQTEHALFDLQLLLAANIVLPTGLPFLLVYWVKKAPKWAALVSTFFGVGWSLLGKTYGFLAGPHAWATEQLNATRLLQLDPSADWPLQVNVIGIILLGGGSFMLSTLFWNLQRDKDRRQIEAFYDQMNRPVDLEKEHIGPADNRQFTIIGRMAMLMGGFILLLALAPVGLKGRLAILLTGGIVLGVGVLLDRLSRRRVDAM